MGFSFFHLPLLLLSSGMAPWENGLVVESSAPVPTRVEFNRDIRPILSDHCFACHGFDKNRRKADLRLDTKDGLLGLGDNGAIVKAGDPEKSDLLHRVRLPEGDSKRMPPTKGGKPLKPEQIQLLELWIRQGAPWEGHWSFQPLALRPQPGGTSAKNPIDAWVVAGLKPSGFQLSPQADRRTLLRRLSFDLTGLPPTPQELEAFLKDTSPNAYEKQVDRLLASPRYGERMAMWWLDLVRYADSVGYHGDQDVSVHPFREYVIKSFNENVPFDRFTREQLAGDLLPEAGEREKIASGYNRLGMMSAEGGVQDREYLAKYAAERVRNASGVWLGVTFGCSECHDHKYDPLGTREFYQFEAFFADIKEKGLYSGNDWGSSMRVPDAALKAQLAQVDAEIDLARRELEKATGNHPWKTDLLSWQLAHVVKAEALDRVNLKTEPEGFVLATGPNPAKNTYTLELDQLPQKLQGLRVEVWPHPSLPSGGPGRAPNGNFVLSEVELSLKVEGKSPKTIPLIRSRATHEQTEHVGGNPYGRFSAQGAIDQDSKGPEWGWAILGDLKRPQAAEFFASTPQEIPAGARLVVTLKQNLNNPKHTLGHFRILLNEGEPFHLMAPWKAPVAKALANTQGKPGSEEAETLATYARERAAVNDPNRAKLLQLQKRREDLFNQAPTTLITETVPPRPIKVLARGNWMDDKGEVVLPATPAILPPMKGVDPKKRATRLDLANWIVDRDNPLTPRVLANRLWKLLFGAGLSRNLDDLGAQGEWPSHPELLDYLASRLIENRWNIKAFLKEVVMTDAYRQSSEEDAARREKDPGNRLLSRQSRHRLDAEMVRDTVLAAAGMLIEKQGGASIKPYQPPGYWSYLNFPTRDWQPSRGNDLYRRSLYIHWQRQYLHPSLLAFDAPCREECTPDRPRSNTPLQALVLLNDPIYVEAARVLGEKTARQMGDDEARLTFLVQTVLGRAPLPEEKTLLLALQKRQWERFTKHPEQARELNSVGEWPRPNDLDPALHGSWTMVARALCNLHETITRE